MTGWSWCTKTYGQAWTSRMPSLSMLAAVYLGKSLRHWLPSSAPTSHWYSTWGTLMMEWGRTV